MPPPVEISIPTTSLSEGHDSKPYTNYNITLRLPLRSFVVQKRYSDFVSLHNTLVSQVGAPPPAPIPGKSWFRSTVSNPDLTEARRSGLETYLRAIAESPDRRWRDSPAWRAFLNLPASTAGSAASASGIRTEGRLHHINLAAANAAAAADPGTWIDLHRELKSSLHDARLCLARRDAAAAEAGGAAVGGLSGGRAVEAGAAAKKALVQAGSLLSALSDGVKSMAEQGRLGDGELRRRRDLLAAARVEREGLEKLSASLAGPAAAGGGSSRGGAGVTGGQQASSTERSALIGSGGSGGARASGRVLGAPLQETERTRELDNSGVVQLQRQMMEEQNEDVDVLARIVRRQKEMGLAIHDEVERQTAMLDRVNEDVDRLGGKIKVAKDRTRRLGG